MGLAIRAPSVAAVALFEPLVAAVVVAERLPETGLVAIDDAQTTNPLGALPEVARGHDQSCRTAVLGCEGLAVVLPRDEGLAVEHVTDRQVRRVATVAEGDDERRGRFELDMLEEGVDADAAPSHVEMRPLRDAADVDRPVSGRQGHELVP